MRLPFFVIPKEKAKETLTCSGQWDKIKVNKS
jgi:hypothetical protein